MAVIDLLLDGDEYAERDEQAVCKVHFDKLIMAGYTGRNQAEVQAHIDELKAHGIPAPRRVPTLYACTPELLTAAEEIAVLGDDTSGEAEFVLYPHPEGMLVGVGSDHTDRKLEETDIPRAKQLCAKVVSRDVWRLAGVTDHWDDLVLRAWVGEEGEEVLYQEGPLARMMAPEAILACVRDNAIAPVEDAVVFSGTLPLIGRHVQAASRFSVALDDPRRGRSLRCAYRVRVLDYLRD